MSWLLVSNFLRIAAQLDSKAEERLAEAVWNRRKQTGTEEAIEKHFDDDTDFSSPKPRAEVNHWYWSMRQIEGMCFTSKTEQPNNETDRILVLDFQWHETTRLH